jgi:signal transduction histidine kinase
MRADTQPQPSTNDIENLRLEVKPISAATTVNEAAELFLLPENARMLCLPVVEEGRPIGTISRHQLNDIFLRRFGRELFGLRPVHRVMNRQPLVVSFDAPLDEAAAYVTAHLGAPITEDFVIVESGEYRGMGIVLDLISALQSRVTEGSRRLSEAYEKLQASQAQLVQSEKMASLGQMVAGVAHEINTPLGYVRNNVEMMQSVFEQVSETLNHCESLSRLLMDETADETVLSAEIAACNESIAGIRDSGVLEDTTALFSDTLFGADQIRDLVVNLRNFSRLDLARLAHVSLNDCIDQTLVIANNVLKGKVEIIKRYGDIPKVRCSPSQINQVLLNLMTNAAQAIEHDQGKLLLKTESTDGRVLIGVQDNGKGISDEHLQKIFDPFFTTKAVGQGTGLGLSISYQIIQAHGGTIRVASKPGAGTLFEISLPVDAAPAESLSEAA